MMSESQKTWQPHYARREQGMRASDIRELLKLLEQPEVISFAGGIPDSALLPTELARSAYQDVLSNPKTASQSLQYSTSEGYEPLRHWITQHMASLGIGCRPENVLLTNGSQQGLEFLAKLFVTPGNSILTTAPTYLGALQAFSSAEPVYDPCLGDHSNATPEACRKYAAALSPSGIPAMAYIVPDFANPSGETLSHTGRLELLRLARELEVPLIEDAAYTALRYDGQPIAPIQALDLATCGDINRSCVVYCGTFSKVISPGLRIGWMVAAEPIIQKLVLIKQAADLNSPLINQMVMHQMATTSFDSLAAKAREVYAARRDVMLEALSKHFSDQAQWSRPDGGLFIWVRLNQNIDAKELLRIATTNEQVAFVPGAGFYPPESARKTADRQTTIEMVKTNTNGRSNFRLSFSQNTPENIREGIRRLRKALDRLI